MSLKRWGPVVALLAVTSPASADWSVTAGGYLFYTDDVALFSATRRLNLHGDPTQPALDTSLTGKGSDMVFEPDLSVGRSFDSSWGRTDLLVKAQGFIFTLNPQFNQASAGIEILHAFTPKTAIRLRYYTAPDQLLGENEDRLTHTLTEERVTSHIGSFRFEQRLSENVEVRLLGRVGSRIYNQAFSQRDTTFWTIGPHLAWRVREGVKLVLGYHYERGVADGREQPQLKDDVSYINNYVTAGIEAELTRRLSLELGVHYERNDWTSSLGGDERNGTNEKVFQGEIMFLYRLTEQTGLTVGFQRSNRRQSFESESVYNTNVSVGATYRF
ncbi:MAG TPA: hypothetical protein VLE03_05250 [Nitrospiraceae bacterium]|nr:hypothetical protein [Nitrospiraceae bacterium]